MGSLRGLLRLLCLRDKEILMPDSYRHSDLCRLCSKSKLHCTICDHGIYLVQDKDGHQFYVSVCDGTRWCSATQHMVVT